MNELKTFLIFEMKHEKEFPEEFRTEDDPRGIEEVARYFLKEFTKEGDKIIDPFAGFGTTLIISEEMGRIPFGIEFDKRRAEYIRSHIKNKDNLINGSSLELNSFDLPEFDFCFTSPPFTYRSDEDNPFTNYTTVGNYDQYLRDFYKIFFQLKQVMKRDSYLVIEVSNVKKKGEDTILNIKEEGEVTTLAWDVAKEVSKVFHYEGEIVIAYEGKGRDETSGYGYDVSYCLVFKNK